MRVRTPEFDFSGVSPHWAEDREMTAFINASNMLPMYVEPFLISVLRRAKQNLDPVRDAALIEDVELFSKQEAQHFKAHGAFMVTLRAYYGPKIRQFEDEFAASYDAMLATRSLRSLLAYSAAFEERASAGSAEWVDGVLDRYVRPTDPRPMALFTWHLAEEYEHRSIVDEVTRRLYGRPFALFYAYKVIYFWKSAAHLEHHRNRVFEHLLRVDREGLGAEEQAESRRRAAEVRKLAATTPWRQLRKKWRLLKPSYRPSQVPAPQHLDEVLARYDGAH